MLYLVCGVAGSGKTTVGQLLAQRLSVEFADADDLHPPGNRAKMAAGQALSDADRGPWLAAVGAWLDAKAVAGESGVMACSALKRAYREMLTHGRAGVRVVFLRVPSTVVSERLAARQGHFFPRNLAASQFAALEEPTPDEGAIVVDADSSPEEVVERILSASG